MNLQEKIAKNLKKCRRINKITQKDMAELLGCSQAYVSQIEKGTAISLKKLDEIRRKLGCSVPAFSKCVFNDCKHHCIVIDRQMPKKQTSQF